MASIEFKTLEQFMPYWCQKILPAVYDDSLSYYQLLGRILQKYNEVIEIVNKHSETLVDHENRITAAEAQIELNRQAIEALKEELAKLDEQVKQNTANIAALTERVNGHDEAIQSLRDLIGDLQQNNRNWRATVISNHDMLLQGTVLNADSSITTKIITFDSNGWGKLLNNGNGCFPLKGTGASVGMVALKIERTADAVQYPAFGFLIEDNDLHFFTATYTKNGTQIATNYYGATDNWTEVELLDITNIKQSLGDGEYDTISQKVLTQLINSKLNHDMGITGATAGQYINVATVNADGKPLTYGVGTPGGGGSGVDIVQTTGQSTTSVMSQKAVTDQLNAINTSIVDTTSTLSTRVTVVYPTTAGGTDGKFVLADGTTATRMLLLANVFGKDGSNEVFTVKKTGSTSWDRITWFKASAGEGIYDFAWYETDGTNAKAGVDRLTVATNGQFAVIERSSTSFGQDAPGSLIAGEFEINKTPITLEYKTAPNVTNGINGGYLKDEIISGISTVKEGVERLLRYAFPVISGKSTNDNYATPRLRLAGYSVQQTLPASATVVFYAPWAGYDGGNYTSILRVECNIGIDDGVPYGNFTIKYYAPGI